MERVSSSQRLKEVMDEKGLRQVDVVNKCAPFAPMFRTTVNKVDICQYLAGKYEPSQTKIAVLALALNVSEAWLMGYDVPKERIERKADDNFEISQEEQELIIKIRRLSDRDKAVIVTMLDAILKEN